jgi:hypothetical protein
VINFRFSSTAGVQISMYRFAEAMYNSGSRTAIGAGLSRTTSMRPLEPHGVNVVGGRTTRMGVASSGFTLGGGLF